MTSALLVADKILNKYLDSIILHAETQNMIELTHYIFLVLQVNLQLFRLSYA